MMMSCRFVSLRCRFFTPRAPIPGRATLRAAAGVREVRVSTLRVVCAPPLLLATRAARVKRPCDVQ